MRKIFRRLGTSMVVAAVLAISIAGAVSADSSEPLGPDPLGPNPWAGDGVPDGSDLDSPNGPSGPNGDMTGLD